MLNWTRFVEQFDPSISTLKHIVDELDSRFNVEFLKQTTENNGLRRFYQIFDLNVEARLSQDRWGGLSWYVKGAKIAENSYVYFAKNNKRFDAANEFKRLMLFFGLYQQYYQNQDLSFGRAMTIPIAKIKDLENQGFEFNLGLTQHHKRIKVGVSEHLHLITIEFKKKKLPKMSLAWEPASDDYLVFSGSVDTKIDPETFFDFVGNLEKQLEGGTYENLIKTPEYQRLLNMGLRDISTDRQKKTGNLNFQSTKNPELFYAIAKTGYVRRGATGRGHFTAGDLRYSPIAPKQPGATMQELMQILIDYLERQKETALKKKLSPEMRKSLDDPQARANIQNFDEFGLFD